MFLFDNERERLINMNCIEKILIREGKDGFDVAGLVKGGSCEFGHEFFTFYLSDKHEDALRYIRDVLWYKLNQ